MLKRTTIAVPLAGGVDTKTDAKIVVPTKLLRLADGDFTKSGSVRTRKGYVEVPAQDIDGTPITDALSVAALGDGFILLCRTNAYMLDRVLNAWAPLGAYTPLTHRQQMIAASNAQQTQPDMASTNGVTAVAWLDSRGGLRCSVFDDASGASFVSEYELVASAANPQFPRVTAVASNLVVTWLDRSADAIRARVIRTIDVLTSVAEGDVDIAEEVNPAGDQVYDIVGADDAAFLAYHQDPAVADTCQLVRLNSGAVVTHSVTVGADTPDHGLCVTAEADQVYVAYFTEGGAGTLTVEQFGVATLTAGATYADAPPVVPDTLVIGPNAAGGVTAWLGLPEVADSDSLVHVVRFDSALAVVDDDTEIRHAALVTSGFYDGYNSYAIVRYAGSDRSNIQNTYYVYRDDGVMVGRMLYGSATSDVDTLYHPQVKALGDDKFQAALPFARQVQVNLDAITGASAKLTPVFGHTSIQHCTIDTSPAVHAVEVDGVLYTGGGLLWAIDGTGAPVEAQMQMFPDVIAADIVAQSGGDLEADSTYNYRVYYEATNGRGQRVRSMALPIPAATAGGNRKFRLTIPTLAHTNFSSRSPVAIVVYRALANSDSFYYRVSSADPTATGANGYIANSTSANSVTFDDNVADDSLESREVDYISFGEHQHLAFDGPAVIAPVQNRLFAMGGGQSPNRPQYSLLRRDGFPVESNDTFVVTEFPEAGGDVVAMADMNGTPVVFKQRAIYALGGTGPTNSMTNLGSPYEAKAVSSDVGCSAAKSVVATRDGVYFKSNKGIYLLDQGFQVQYIGAEIEAYNAQDITGAAVVPDTNQVVFVTSDGVSLMYDYFYQAWGWYTNHEGLAVATTDADFAYLRNDGALYIRDDDSYSDAGVPYGLYFMTAPLRLADSVQGFWRLRRVQVLGEYVSSHTLEIGIYYDRETSPYQTIVFEPDEVLDLSVWGEDVPWGGDTPWGGARNATDYNFDEKVQRQKCSTVRFEFRGLPGATPGASYEITELALEVAMRDGLARLPAARKI